jgi:predicted phage baseplate assembly protein
MSLPTPNLDDRRFQDIVDEAKRRIPVLCPEWTDHNVSDPGVTMIELFAWMVEMMLYRLNQVPEKSYITFMDLMGVRLQPPAAARTDLTFWLAAPATDSVTIQAGSEVATVQTTAEDAVSFSTDADIVVRPTDTIAFLTSAAAASEEARTFEDQKWKLTTGSGSVLAFSARPRPGDSFYIGDSGDISGHILSLTINCTVEGIGVNPDNPPLAWQAWCDEGWRAAEVGRDGTGGLNKNGEVVLFLPPGMAVRAINGQASYWVRCLHTQPLPGQQTYSASPQIHSLETATLGATTSATHASSIVGEVIGRSDGTPGQRFRLEFPPVLPRRPGETIEVQADDGSWEPWSEREQFGESRPSNQHFTLDSVSGEVCFGPAIREPDGSVRQYGAIPPRGCLIRCSRYRSGGGAVGNVGKGKLAVMKRTIPYVDRVENRRAANGGLNAESLERAKMRAPQMLRTSSRAVTAEDYEYLAREAAHGIARARCIQPRAASTNGSPPPGVVRLLLVPALDPADGRILPEQLRPADSVVQEVQRYLDERRLLTTIVVVGQPAYTAVTVDATLKARASADADRVRQDALVRLNRFLNPLVGGADGNGWPFGRDLFISEIYTILQNTPGVEYLEQVALLVNGKRNAQGRISLAEDDLITSGEHQIRFV